MWSGNNINSRLFAFLLATFFLSNVSFGQCDFVVDLSTDGLHVTGTIYNSTDFGPYSPQAIEWYNPVNGETFGNQPIVNYTFAEYGPCAVCVDFEAVFPNGQICTETICNQIYLVDPALSCEAIFQFQSYNGPMPVVGGITFSNLSTGPYTDLSWDFGDGSFFSESIDSITHFYSESGSYDVKLTVWNNNTQECLSEYNQIIDVWVSDDPCDQLDCIWPGDTNNDGKANLEDLLNIGIGFGVNGPPRDNPSNEWIGQPGEDWDQHTGDGVNYKYLDCNGDGTIGFQDIMPVQDHYTMMENGVSITESDGIPVKLQFDVDTVVVTENTEFTELNAALMLGSSNIPMEDIYGIVLYFNYNTEYVDSTSQVEMDYNENSFFGDLTVALPLSRDIKEEGQVDMALTRRNFENTSGQGQVVTFKFIVDSDIIDGRDEAQGESFTVGINVVKAIDKLGNEIELSLSEEPASVFFVNGISTKLLEPELSDQINIYPNPVSENLNINLGDLQGEQIEVYDLLGKLVLHQKIDQSDFDLNMRDFQQGIYLLSIQTAQGLVSKRIVVE